VISPDSDEQIVKWDRGACVVEFKKFMLKEYPRSLVNVADIVDASKEFEYFTCPGGRFSLRYQIEVEAVQPSTGAQRGAVDPERLVKSPIGFCNS
jgi:hypothetical protein